MLRNYNTPQNSHTFIQLKNNGIKIFGTVVSTNYEFGVVVTKLKE
jgi:hypothetical protein